MKGTLTDTGALIALLDRDEDRHADAVDALDRISLPLVTTWAAFTEAMYLLGARAGQPGQDKLWLLVDTDRLLFADLDADQTVRCRGLMAKYADLPMDLADATLVCVAEREKVRDVFTFDSDFTVYRLAGGKQFRVIP